MSDMTSTGSLGQAVQSVWAGSKRRRQLAKGEVKKYPYVAEGRNGERHVIKSAAEEPHSEDVRSVESGNGIFRDRRSK